LLFFEEEGELYNFSVIFPQNVPIEAKSAEEKREEEHSKDDWLFWLF
jgi:hypothetical protein